MNTRTATCLIVLATGLFVCFSGSATQAPLDTAGEEHQKAVYVGWEKCVPCHASIVEAYQGFKRSRNFRILEMRNREHDQQCLPCHTTGYGEQGGFVSVEKTPHLTNVQCEVCHGPASFHIKAPGGEEKRKTVQIPRNLCTRCHVQHGHREL